VLIVSRWGPSEVTLVGSLQGWTVVDKLKHIQVPVLVYNGEFDEAQTVCVEPFFWGLEKVKWVTVQGGSHMTHLEKRTEVIKLVAKFLEE
jgi:pimeloyl-ACP methyl ester carboxylesterase